ncbi:uncharacterized protein CBL_01175 [Carabus blaptoides fortunei]
MNLNENIRHNIVPPIQCEVTTNNRKKLKWLNFIALFFIQFLISQIVLSYGIYTIHFIQNKFSISEALWPPIIFLASSKILGPWCRDIAERYYEYHFRPFMFVGVLMCSFGISLCAFSKSPLINGLLFGILGGFGSNLIINFLQCHLLDMFPYQTQIILGIQHLGIAVGLFITPHILQLLFDSFQSIPLTFLIHGALILHVLLVVLPLKRSKMSTNQNLTAYNNIGTRDDDGKEMINMTNIKKHLNSTNDRNWKSPSDNMTLQCEDCDNDEISEKPPSPIPQHKINMGVDVLPQIIEEDEEETDDDANTNSKRNSLLMTNNIKRLSVISSKFEELIVRNEDESVNEISPIKQTETMSDASKSNYDFTINPIDNHVHNLIVIDASTVHSNNVYCTPYLRYKCHRNMKYIYQFVKDMTVIPVLTSLRIIEFYPSLLTTLHSMLSPLIFLNFIAFQPNRKEKDINVTELSFMFTITGFAYLVFLITLPWITEISKRNLKYLYMSASLISAFGIYLFLKTDTDDFRVLSCLIYGFGFGIESYLKEIVLKESLGVTNWSKTEGTLDCLSGILLIIFISKLYDETCLIENPYFEVSNMECWPCEDVHSVINLTDSKNYSLYQSGIPYIIKTLHKPLSLEDIQELYKNNSKIFTQDAQRIKSNNPKFLKSADLLHFRPNNSNTHISWRINRMVPARIVRTLFPKPYIVSQWSGQSTERYLMIDDLHAIPYVLPNPECSSVILTQSRGERTIVLRPSKECNGQCRTTSVILKATYSLWYNWWYWRPISFPAQNATDISISYITSFC